MAGEAIGHGNQYAFKRNAGATWGQHAAVVGAGDGVEIDRHSLSTDSQLIENVGVSGKTSQLPGVKGSQLHTGDLGPMDLYYDGNQRMIAMALGLAGVPALTAGGSATYDHTFKMADTHKGLYASLVEKSAAAIREWPYLKVGGWTIECESGQAAKLTLPIIPNKMNHNLGAPDTDFIVVPVEPANGARTIANQPTEPTPLSILVVDANTSITEYVLTIVGEDEHGDVVTEIYRLSTDGLSKETVTYFRSIVSIVGSELAGTATGDTVQVGITNGKNNDTTIAGVTLPADRNVVTFPQMRFYVNDQTAAGFGNPLSQTFEKFIRRLRISCTVNLRPSVTTRYHRLTDEPLSDGFWRVELGFSFDRWSTITGGEYNQDLIKNWIAKTRKKVLVEFMGPITEGILQYHYRFWFNNVQFTEGNVPLGGPGQMGLDMAGMASRALTVPTGFPSGFSDALGVQLRNKNSADALA